MMPYLQKSSMIYPFYNIIVIPKNSDYINNNEREDMSMKIEITDEQADLIIGFLRMNLMIKKILYM
jgi:hypothetical protein